MAYPFVRDEFRLELAKDVITSRPPLAPLDNMRLQQFANYVGGFWVSKLNVKDIWEQFSARGPRNTNMAEGCHNGLHSWLSNFHPTLAEVIQFLQVAQFASQNRIQALLRDPMEVRTKNVKLRKQRRFICAVCPQGSTAVHWLRALLPAHRSPFAAICQV